MFDHLGLQDRCVFDEPSSQSNIGFNRRPIIRRMVVLGGHNDYVIRRAYRRAQPVIGVPPDRSYAAHNSLRTASLLKRESFRLVL